PGNLVAPDPMRGLPASLSDAINVALTENPAILAAQFSEQASEHAVRSAQGALLPTVSLSARTSRSAEWINLGLPTYSNSIGVSVTVPLYQSGAEYSSIRSAKESSVQSQLALDDARRTVVQSVTTAWQ